MSEKRAKRERKAQAVIEAPAKKKDIRKTVANLVVILAIAAIAALGAWAAYGKIKAELPQDQEQVQTTQTVADLAAAEGTTAQELLERCGLTESGLTGESAQEEFFAVLTVENFAKYEGKTVDELKAEYGIESVENDALWQDAQMQMPMGKVAELQYGTSFEEFVQQAGLPEGITAEMTQGQALAIMQATQATQGTEE